MNTNSEPIYFNKSAYVALLCLIAFVIVITICVIKQFIWDPLLSKSFETLRPVLSESVRRVSSTFYRLQSINTSRMSLLRSLSDACVRTNDSLVIPTQQPITLTQSLPSNNNQPNLPPPRSYGSSSSNVFGYTNYALDDEEINLPQLYFSCEYDPSTYHVKLNIHNLRYMNIFSSAIKSNTSVVIRFLFYPRKSTKFHETSAQLFGDVIAYNETFLLLTQIHSGDRLDYEIKFMILLLIDGNTYEIAEGIHSLKNDCLTYVLYVERTLPMNLKFIENQTK